MPSEKCKMKKTGILSNMCWMKKEFQANEQDENFL